MRDFLDDLEQRLAVMAEQHPELRASEPPQRSRRRPAILGAIAALLAAIAAALTMTGTSLADLPILDTPTRDASGIKERVPDVARAGVDFSQAHAFETPGGPGYVLVNKDRQVLCVVVPDPDAPGDYGNSCSPIAKVERAGMLTEMVGDLGTDPDATSLATFVLPEDAKAVRLQTGDRTTEPTVQDGVVVLDITEESTLSWTVDGRPGRLLLEGPFPETTSITFECPDGTMASTDEVPSARTPEEANQAMKRLRRELC
ncbi:MAG: hypothetical protein JHD16_13055 [Solirubrobacteraceae bacterium]|nr:hypothetical protein [Solirubrobacteraceae bacterium]